MTTFFFKILRLIFVTLLFFNSFTAFSQPKKNVKDSLPALSAADSFELKLKQIAESTLTKSVKKFETGRTTAKQTRTLSEVRKTSHKIISYLKRGIDSNGINMEMTDVMQWYETANDAVFVNADSVQTQRNLATSLTILKELLNRTSARDVILEDYHKVLVGFRNDLDSLGSDSSLYNMPTDTAALQQYLRQVITLSADMGNAENNLNQSITSVEGIQFQVRFIMNRLASSIEEIKLFQQKLNRNMSRREFANLWNFDTTGRPFKDVLGFSLKKEKLVLTFYTLNNLGKIASIIFLILLLTYFLRSMKKHLQTQGYFNNQQHLESVMRFPLLSAILIIISIFQFIYTEPPFIFIATGWAISALALTIIFWNTIEKFWRNVWIIALFLFFGAYLENMILQASQPERWLMFALAIAGIGFSIFTLYKGKKISLREKGLPFFIGFLGLMEFISLITNAFGRYNLAKSFLTSGFFSLIVGVLLIWTVRLINEALSLASEAYKDQDKKVVYINFEKVGKRVSPVFYLLLTIGWLILFGRNFYAYKILTEPIVDFLSMERNIGNNTFTIQSILFFFGILILSGLTSKIVSFFASGNFHSPGTATGKKTGIGSWLLLIRIAIMSIGVFFAFAVAGIPLDKLAIILGALSVGIGFGLQTLINNLVSGLIIAFEKPINVGDIVEIGGQTGTMKSIGFRSSVISTPEGSDVIIPNGELLSQHLINWTMTDSRRRVNIQVGVAYGSNLESVVKALQELMEADDRILKFPAPAVMVKEFNSSSIDLSLFFWVGHFNTAFQLKSDMMLAIDIKFKELGIEIPFPQQDLHIKTMVKHEGS